MENANGRTSPQQQAAAPRAGVTRIGHGDVFVHKDFAMLGVFICALLLLGTGGMGRLRDVPLATRVVCGIVAFVPESQASSLSTGPSFLCALRKCRQAFLETVLIRYVCFAASLEQHFASSKSRVAGSRNCYRMKKVLGVKIRPFIIGVSLFWQRGVAVPLQLIASGQDPLDTARQGHFHSLQRWANSVRIRPLIQAGVWTSPFRVTQKRPEEEFRRSGAAGSPASLLRSTWRCKIFPILNNIQRFWKRIEDFGSVQVGNKLLFTSGLIPPSLSSSP